MAQYQMNLRDYQRVLRKRYKIIIFTTLMLALFSYIFAQRQVPVYTTTASVKIDQTSNLASTLMSTVTYNIWDNLATQSEIMKSFDTIERVAKRLGMIDPGVSSDEVRRNDRYIGVIKSIQAKILTQQSGNTNIVDITARSTNPLEAREIANTVAVVFREYHHEQKQKQATETGNFIDDQLAACEQRLKAAEDSLKAFQLTMRVPSIQTDTQDAIRRFNELEKEYDDLTQRINQLDLELSQLIQRRDYADVTSIENQSDPGRTQIYIDWVSAIDQQSQTLMLLNNDLVRLQLEKMDKLLYYNADHPQVRDIETKIQAIVSQLIREYTARGRLLRERREELARLLAMQREKVEGLPDAQRRFLRLQREVALQERVLQLLLERQQEVLIRKQDTAEDVSIVKFATLPTVPDNANTGQVVVTGLIVGLLLGLVLAFVFETLDTSIGTIEDVEEYLELPVLGIVPHIDIEEMIVEKYPHLENDPQVHYYSRLVALFAPKTPVAEAYRTLRTNLSFSGIGQDKPVKTLVFTSSSLQEGKSTTLANLAIVTAQMGKRTLLVGCNLRRPSLYKTFGIKRAPGVTDIILGSIPWEDCVQSVTDIMVGSFGVPEVLTASGLDNLFIIESGQTPPNPSELLSSPQMERFLKEVSEEFDIVYVDMPPTLPVTDAAILAPKVDGIVLIYQVGRVPRNALKRAKDQLQQVGANVIGVVLNDVRAEITGFHPATEYFIHYYGEDARAQQSRVRSLFDDIKNEIQPLAKSPSEMTGQDKSKIKRILAILGVVGATGLIGLLLSRTIFAPPDIASTPSEPGASTAAPSPSSLQFGDPAADSLHADTMFPAVISIPRVGVRSGPGASYEQIGTARSGDRVPVVGRRQQWYRIILADGRDGWIPMAAAAVDSVPQ